MKSLICDCNRTMPLDRPAQALARMPGARTYGIDQAHSLLAALRNDLAVLCDAVVAQPRAVTWRAVADFTRTFIERKTQAFDLHES